MGLFDLFKKKKIVLDSENTDLENKSFVQEVEKSSAKAENEFIHIETLDCKKEIIIKPVPVKEEILDEDFDCLEELGLYNLKLDLSNYEYPVFPLLSKEEIDSEQIINPSRIEEILKSFGVKINSITTGKSSPD